MFWFGNRLIALKRAIGGILVAILSLGYSLGLSFDIQGVFYRPDSYATYSFYDSTKKVGKTEFLERKATYNIKLARNESEACQIVVRSRFNSTNKKRLRLEFTEFKNGDGDVLPTEVFEEKYISCVSDKNYGTFPDALVPVDISRPFVIIPRYQNNWPYYIRVRADKDTPAGEYSAKITGTFTDGDKPEFIADVKATVWDFALPETPSCRTAFGINGDCIDAVYGVKDDPARSAELYKKYYDLLLDRKISAYDLPFDILSDEADAYMSDPKVVSFCVPYRAGDDALLQRYYAKIQSNPEWAEKAYFYPIDEPTTEEAYAQYEEITDRLERLCPGYHMVTPFYTASVEIDGKTRLSTELQAGGSDIVCPLSSLYESEDFLKQIDARRADGSKIWNYVCCGPRDDYCNVFIHWEGIRARLLFWQQKALNINGLLYWSATYWKDVFSPWNDPLTTPWTGSNTFGDGSLMYNGKDGPVTSMRLEEISDGVDDFEFLTMAEKLFGREYVDKKIAEVFHNLTDYTLDDSLLARVRVQTGDDIENALAK